MATGKDMLAKEPVILHVDMDAFFASVEQKSDPRLKDKPIIVCGDPKSRTVVAAASYQARKYGIKAGMPLAQARALCPQAIFVTANHDKYAYTARRIFEILKEFSPCVEIYSIDEAFIDATDVMHLYSQPRDLAFKIKDRIKHELGLTCSVGIGPNKLLAKFASEVNKPDGFFMVKKDQAADILKDIPVQALCGIGERTKQRLLLLGITTCHDLAQAPEKTLVREFGILGSILKQMGRGDHASGVCPYYQEPDAKSIGNSMTLPRDIREKDRVKSAILFLAEKVARRMREGSYQGKTVTLTVRLSDFSTSSKSHTIDIYTDDGAAIYSTALKIFEAFGVSGKKIRMLGVSASNIQRDQSQDVFFSYKGNREINKAMDKINNRFGECSIHRAASYDKIMGLAL